MVVVRIEKVNPVTYVNTQRGKAKIVRIEATELSLKKRYKITVWMGSNDFIYNKGDEIEMDIRRREKDGKPVLFRGEEQWSCDYNSIAPIERAEDVGFPNEEIPPPEEPDEETPKNRMWRLKERRDYRGRCLVYAVETYKMSGEAKNLPILEIQSRIQELANEYLKYIYE